jgi:two-component sensor histidine kinase
MRTHQERQKHRYFLICLAASIPPLLLFGIDDLLDGRRIEALLTFAQGLLFACLFVWGILSKSMVFLRAGMLLFSLFLIYLIVGGTGNGYGSLWVYTFPLASFYMLEKREGIVWTVCFYVLMTGVLLVPSSDEVRALDKAFVIRLVVSFLIVSIMAYAYADVRERLYSDIQKELMEKKMLLNEIHHRVKNNLSTVQSILSLQCGEVRDKISKSVLLEGENRIRSMALLHEALYSHGQSSQVEVSEYLGKVIEHLSDAYKGNGLNVEVGVDILKTLFDVEIAMPCGIIVNELLTNVFKHATPEARGVRVTVSLGRGPDDEYVLSVRDNGKGLPEGFDSKANETFGFKIVNAFVDQIDGRLEFLSGTDGTEFRVSFRLPESPATGVQVTFD